MKVYYLLCHQSGLPNDDRSLVPKDTRHKHRTREVSGGLTLPTYLLAVGVLSVGRDSRH